MKLTWLDIRAAGAAKDAIRMEAIHQRVDAIVADSPADLAGLPPTVTRVLFPPDGPVTEVGGADVVILDPTRHGDPTELMRHHPDLAVGRFVDVRDAASLQTACESAMTEPWTVVSFRDPTRIPLEIVLAAAAGRKGGIVAVVADPAEAAVVLGVLEHGSDGVLMPAGAVGDATRLRAAAESRSDAIELVELSVVGTAHVGLGERACVDTCAYLRRDEGILVGSHTRGMVLCASETHPLPYMPTRPFRVNAGALMSYTLGAGERTSYLSELRAGGRVRAVDAAGRTRLVTVGRLKVETRPLLSIDAVAPDGRAVNVIVLDVGHVRVLGPGGTVLNSTELVAGDRILGYLPDKDRHVGYPIDEFCQEQ